MATEVLVSWSHITLPKQLLLGFLLVFGYALAQEQWQLDQAAGEYWYVGRTDVYSYDPKENNPGTIKVIPDENGDITIEIHANLVLNTEEDARVRYAFNEEVLEARPPFEQWEASGIGFLGITYVTASPAFVSEFMQQATKDGYVEVEMVDEEGESVFRRFIFQGFADAYNALAADLGVDQVSQVAAGGQSEPPAAEAEAFMFKGWEISKGLISKTTTVNGNEIKIVVVGSSGTDKPDIRFYPNAQFTRNGETRVRGEEGDTVRDWLEFGIWPTVLEEGRYGYVSMPQENDYYYYSLEDPERYTLELIDKDDKHIMRTFDIKDLKQAFDEMRRTYPELAIGWGGDYLVRFDVVPAGAVVDLETRFLLGWVPEEQITTSPTFLELEEGTYRYTAALAGHLGVEGRFTVPQTTTLTIVMEAPSGTLAEQIEDGYVSSELVGDELWPLSVKEGELSCEPPGMAIINLAGEHYALNRAAEDVYPSAEPQLTFGKDLEDLVVLSERALQLCSADGD